MALTYLNLNAPTPNILEEFMKSELLKVPIVSLQRGK